MNKFAITGISLVSLVTTSSIGDHCSSQNLEPTQAKTEVCTNSINSFNKIFNPIWEKPKVKIYPDTVTQGQTGIVSIKSYYPLVKPYYIDENGKKLPIYKDNDSLYSAFYATTPNYKPGKHKIVLCDESKRLNDSLDIQVKGNQFAPQKLSVSDSVSHLHATEYEKAKIRAALDSVSNIDYFELPPYDAPTAGPMKTEYGAKRSSFHNGIDIAAPKGQPIKAILPGKVLVAEKFTMNGGTVIIDHGRFKTVCLHLSAFNVKEGDTVLKGQIIGKVGSTGYSTGPHLHFGIYPNGTPVDPEQWLKPITKSPDLLARLKTVKSKSLKDTTSYIRKFYEPIKNDFLAREKSCYLKFQPQKILKDTARYIR